MRILHTEASTGWGGQEIRILREAQAFVDKGHFVTFAVNEGGELAVRARAQGFEVAEFPLNKKHSFQALWKLARLIKNQRIDVVNTHSSLDAWLGGLAARLTNTKIIRTRHLSTKIRPGFNSIVLYNWLADNVVTTCQATAETIRQQARLPETRCCSIPTGLACEKIQVTQDDAMAFRQRMGLTSSAIVVGTLCVLRSWKGISDLLQAAKMLSHIPQLKWIIVGDGPSAPFFRSECKKLKLENVLFTGYEENPYPALAAMDIFMLLSTAHEGVSQAVLQAAFLQKPLITTTTGGLGEVCIHEQTGYQVGTRSPQEIATCVEKLAQTPALRQKLGQQAQALVEEQFSWTATIVAMEQLYARLRICSPRLT